MSNDSERKGFTIVNRRTNESVELSDHEMTEMVAALKGSRTFLDAYTNGEDERCASLLEIEIALISLGVS